MNRREVRVFISSTFRDMLAEREVLVKRVSPVLRALASRRRLGFFEVDLRWGITEEQAARGEVLSICLEEVQRCRPYFIGLLGERYGWVPQSLPDELRRTLPWLEGHPEASVTEREIVHGVLNDPAMASRAMFYFRDPAWIQRLPPERQADFLAESPEAARRLAELKERIRRSGLPLHEGYGSPEELGELVLADLRSALDRDYPQQATPDALAAQNADHELYMEEKARFFVGQDKLLEELDRHALGEGPPAILTGPAGSGKSAALAAWSLRFREGHSEVLLIPHFARASADSGDVELLAGRILGMLKNTCGVSLPLPELRAQKLASLPGWLEVASRERRIVLVLDGLDQLTGPAADPLLSWLPHALAGNVRLVLSCRSESALGELLRRERGYRALSPEPLRPDEVLTLTRSYLGSFRKQLDPALEQQIAQAGAGFRMQGLRLLLEELRVFGDHEQLAARLAELLSAAEPRSQFLRFLQRLEKDFQGDCPGMVARALRLLRASRAGLSEEELVELLAVARLHWSWLRLALGELLVSRRGLLTFADEQLRQSAADLVAAEAADPEAHRQLADYFAAAALPERRLQEYGRQLMASAQWQRLQQALTDLPFLRDLWEADAPEVLRLWAALQENTGVDLAQAYAAALADPASLSPYAETLFDLFRETGQASAAGRVALLSAGAQSGSGPSSPRMLALVGVSYLEQGRPQEALPYLEQAAGRTVEMIGEGNEWAATAWCNLAAAQRMLGRTEESQRQYEAALKVLSEQRGENSPHTQEAIHGLGVLHYFRKDYARALELFERSLAIQVRLKGANDAHTAVIHNDLANTSGYLGRYEQAEEHHRRALAIREALLGPRNPLVADSCFNLGNILDLAGRQGEALSLHRRALDIRADRLGAEHPEIRRSQGMIAGVCQRWGAALEATLQIKQNRRDPTRLQEAADAFKQIGEALAEAGAQGPAAEALGRALGIAEQLHGRNSPLLAALLARLGEQSLWAREPARGLPHLLRAAQLLQRALPDEEVTALAEVHELLGLAYRDAGDLVMALDHLTFCLTTRMKRFGPLHPSVGTCQANIAGVHLRAGRFSDAERYARQALENTEAARGPYHPLTARACGNHGAALLRLNRVPEGLGLLKRSWEILQLARGDDHPTTRSALQFLRQAEERYGTRT